MEKNTLKLIYQVCPKQDLMEALYCKDYDTSIAVINGEIDKINFLVNTFTIFDELDVSLKSGSSIPIIRLIQKCRDEYAMFLALDTINTLDNLDKDLSIEETAEEKDDLELCTTYLSRVTNITSKQLTEFANQLLLLVDKKYPKVDSLRDVFAMPFKGSDVIKDMVPFIEDLIYGGEVTVYTVCESLIDNKPDDLMEQMAVIRYLRELYYTLREPEVNNLQKQIQSILDFGLKRTK